MADATKDFEELLGCLKRHEARFVVVGAHAVAYHAKPRYTKDFDLLIDPNVVNGERVVAALEEFGFGGLGIVPADFGSTGRILQLGVPPNRIDMMTSIDGVDFDEVWNGRVEGSYGDQIVPFIGRAALIKKARIAASSGPRRSGAVAGHGSLITSQPFHPAKPVGYLVPTRFDLGRQAARPPALVAPPSGKRASLLTLLGFERRSAPDVSV